MHQFGYNSDGYLITSMKKFEINYFEFEKHIHNTELPDLPTGYRYKYSWWPLWWGYCIGFSGPMKRQQHYKKIHRGVLDHLEKVNRAIEMKKRHTTWKLPDCCKKSVEAFIENEPSILSEHIKSCPDCKRGQSFQNQIKYYKKSLPEEVEEFLKKYTEWEPECPFAKMVGAASAPCP